MLRITLDQRNLLLQSHTTRQVDGENGMTKPGRPLLEPERGNRQRREIRITDDRWEQAKRIGKGSASEGIAKALDAMKKQGETT